MGKWETFHSIEPSCWKQIAPPGGRCPIWVLDQGFTSQFYPDEGYVSIYRDGDPYQKTWDICRFDKPAPPGAYELTVRSLRTNGLGYYQINWNSLMPIVIPQSLTRCNANDGAPMGKATLTGTGATLHVVSPEIDEDMTIDVGTLGITLAESKQERQDRLEPWTRMLYWYGRVRELDPPTFQKVPGPIRSFLERSGNTLAASALTDLPMRDFMRGLSGLRFAEAAPALTDQQVQEWQQQKLMPTELAWLWETELPEEIIKLESVMAMLSDPMRQANPIYMPVVPELLKHIEVAKLNLLDMKVLMTIGAVRERYRFKQRAWYNLTQKKPSFKQIAESPNAQQLAMTDPEWQAITNHPLARQEEEEDLEAYQHSKGDFGPSPLQKIRDSDAQWAAMMAGMQQQEAQMMRMMGGMGMPAFALPPMPQIPNLSNPLAQQVPPPAWKIYRPFMTM